MALFEVAGEGMDEVRRSTLVKEGVKEVANLQKYIAGSPQALGEDLFIIAEEFSWWEESRRRVDLLAIDRERRVVVIELKREEETRDADLQALRYAAMTANVTLKVLVEAHQEYLDQQGVEGDARGRILAFWGKKDAEDDVDIDSAKPRIILVSEGFSKELTTTLLWLNQLGVDMRAVRIRAYPIGEKLFIDFEPFLPPPEAEEFRIRAQRKAQEEERVATGRRERTIHTLTRLGIVQADDELVLATAMQGAAPDGADSKMSRARIAKNPRARANVIWEFDCEEYALSTLSEMLRDEHGFTFSTGGLNGFMVWALAGNPDECLWNLAEAAGRE